MDQNSPAVSTVQQRSPSLDSGAGVLVASRMQGDNSVSNSQMSQDRECVAPNRSPGPLNSPQEMPSSTMDDRRGRARSLAVEEAKGT